MSSKPLDGKRIGVLVESQYIPEEIDLYVKKFQEYGAVVDLISDLWGKDKQTFISKVEFRPGTLEPEQAQALEVHTDFKKVDLNQYAAIISSANYVSVRLRYFMPPEGQAIRPEMVRRSPAVQFFCQAMRRKEIVKGALCHGLWLLTPAPEHLAGRKVICHEVVLADVANAGGAYTPSSSGVVVDDDLVTGRSYHETALLIEAIKEQILNRQVQKTCPWRPPISSTKSKGTILVALSERGYWGEELAGPLEVFDESGYSVEFITPTGKRPHALGPSMDSDYVDPPLGRPVTTPEMAAKVRVLDEGTRLDAPLSLAEMMPEPPYFSHPVLVRQLEAYYKQREEASKQFDCYVALLLVGGSGPIVDMVNNRRIHDLILGFYRAGKPIAAECYGVACLAFARDYENRESIIKNKHVTGHCLEYDYKDGTGFLGTDFNMGPPPYPLEYILRDATAPQGRYIGNFGQETSVIVDYPFITGRSTADSYLTGKKLIEVIEQHLRRWGF